ncbi:MAG TPA: hypothetical protein VGA69_12125 [Nitriliruptorales bacterium]
MTKSRRLQVLIEDEQWDRLETVAAERGVSVASLVRQAIDESIPGGRRTRARSARAILDADTMEVPEPGELRRELDAIRGRSA